MKNNSLILAPLTDDDREEFIRDNQEAFRFGATEEFGSRDDHFEEEGEIISRETIERALHLGTAYRILFDGKKAGGVVVRVDRDHGDLDLFFVKPNLHGKGIGYAAWCAVEERYPEVKVWETETPYFEKRNIHFYVNRCGFQIAEFYHSRHPDPHAPAGTEADPDDEMFRFVKIRKL